MKKRNREESCKNTDVRKNTGKGRADERLVLTRTE